MTGSVSTVVFWDPAFILLSVSPFPPFVEFAHIQRETRILPFYIFSHILNTQKFFDVSTKVLLLQSVTRKNSQSSVGKTPDFGRWVNVL